MCGLYCLCSINAISSPTGCLLFTGFQWNKKVDNDINEPNLNHRWYVVLTFKKLIMKDEMMISSTYLFLLTGFPWNNKVDSDINEPDLNHR